VPIALISLSPCAQNKKGSKNAPDLKLTGHTDTAPFALTTSSASASIASGGEDKNVLVWNLADHGEGAEAGRGGRAQDTLEPRHTLKGHEQMVSDVCFKPGADHLLASAADDRVIKLWDTREAHAVQNVRASLASFLYSLPG
jgi:WD40 repeat protein